MKFWKHIHGFCGEVANYVDTYLIFSENTQKAPKITIDNRDWGEIVTTNGEDQTINKALTITNVNASTIGAQQITMNSLHFSNEDKVLLEKSNSQVHSEWNWNIEGTLNAINFNSTSDARAKYNIQCADFDALKIILNTPLYTFQYKDNKIQSFGILAQDIMSANINGFEFVDNKFASGQNQDYMVLHENKLIYVLWKAVQEQQKEINELKAEIRQLKKKD